MKDLEILLMIQNEAVIPNLKLELLSSVLSFQSPVLSVQS